MWKWIERIFDTLEALIGLVIGAVIGLIGGVYVAVKTGGMKLPPEGMDIAYLIGGAILGAVLGVVLRRVFTTIIGTFGP